MSGLMLHFREETLCHPLNLSPTDPYSLGNTHEDDGSDSDSDRNDESSTSNLRSWRHTFRYPVRNSKSVLEKYKRTGYRSTATWFCFKRSRAYGETPCRSSNGRTNTRGDMSASTAAEEAGPISSAISNLLCHFKS